MLTVDPIYILLALCFSAVLWLTSGLSKLLDFRRHQQIVRDYSLIPESLVTLFSVGQVLVEIFLGAGFAIAWWVEAIRPLCSLVACLLLTVYSVAIGINLARGKRNIQCGCAGPGQRQELSIGLLTRNFVLLMVSLIAILPLQPRPMGMLDILTVVLGLIGMGVLYAAFNQAFSQVSTSRLIQGRQ